MAIRIGTQKEIMYEKAIMLATELYKWLQTVSSNQPDEETNILCCQEKIEAIINSLYRLTRNNSKLSAMLTKELTLANKSKSHRDKKAEAYKI